MNLRRFTTTIARREAIEKELGLTLPKIASSSCFNDATSSRNCENMIGSIQVPLGIVGPLLVKGSFEPPKKYYIPLATTEGALIASINRGVKAITQSGGATTISKKMGITRAPVFKVGGILECRQFIDWSLANFSILKNITEKTSSHLTLLDIKPWMNGKNVFLRFSFDCQDAMGMNMATIATDTACRFIQEKIGVKLIAISGNMCVDKKPNALNFIEGRGISVWAETHIPETIVKSVLKTTSAVISEAAKSKLTYGSQLSLTIGANAQIANALSAVFLATGQDLAHVAECSMGITTLEAEENGIYASVYLPDLIVATVGGGTQLDTQKEALHILGLQGGNDGKNALILAEVIASVVLAGEISLLASLSDNSLAMAHKKLARGGK